MTEEQQRRNAKRVRDIEIKRRCEDAAYENKRHKDAFEQKVAGMKMSAEEEKAYRAKLLDAKLDFQFAYAEMEVYMNRYKLKLNYKNNESRMLNRKKGQKDNLPLLSDEEAFEQVMSIDKDAPDYCSRVISVLSDMNEKYDVSYKTMVTLENYKNMLERQITNEAALDIKRQRDMRLKAQAKQPASFDLPPISGVYQDKGQTYGQSMPCTPGLVPRTSLLSSNPFMIPIFWVTQSWTTMKRPG